MHYIAPGVYLDRLPEGTLKLSVEDTVVFRGEPVRVRITRDLNPDKLRAIAPELFPVASPSIVDDVKMLREVAETMPQLGFRNGIGELILRVLDHYAARDMTNPFDFSKPENVRGATAFLDRLDQLLDNAGIPNPESSS